jgi:hypothetical protein
MTEELNDIDGFLGMDFISEHIMYIDFEKRYIYIEQPSLKEESLKGKKLDVKP